MKRHSWMAAGLALLVAGLTAATAARADFEVTGPDGRRIVLKDDGTWRFRDAALKEQPREKLSVTGEGVLTLERRIDAGPNCRFGFRLQNDTNHEIRNIVPTFSVYRASGVLYEARTLGFYSINPGNSAYREVVFQGITCQEIARLQVSGGDRCVMADLDKFSSTGGACLERVRVVPSDLVRFEK